MECTNRRNNQSATSDPFPISIVAKTLVSLGGTAIVVFTLKDYHISELHAEHLHNERYNNWRNVKPEIDQRKVCAQVYIYPRRICICNALFIRPELDVYLMVEFCALKTAIPSTVCKLSAESLMRNNFIFNVRMIVCVCVGVSHDTLSF